MNDEFLGTNNFFMPDGSNRWIHQIDNKVFHAGYLENGNNAYLLELLALENMLNTRKFLMDEMSGQFYAVYGNSYQRMSTKPMLRQAWATGDLIDELAATRQAFGYTGLAGSTPPLAMGMQPTASTSQQPDDLLPRQPAPKTVQYQPPSFKLTRPMTRLTKNERIQQWEQQEKLDMERNQMEKQKEERKRIKEEREQRKGDRKQVEKHENQQRSRINKAFEKIPRFDGTNPSYCFDWLEQTEALVNEHHGWIYREELLLKCGTSVSKTIHALPQGATNQSIKDAVLRNHSNLRTVSQRSNAYHQLHQKPDEALQSYNTRYASFFNLAYPELELDNPLSRMHCIHYASSLYGKLGDEMTGRFNQDLPENLQTAFKKATNFEPPIITKQSINSRKIHEVKHIDVGHEDDKEINEAHVRNPNYKGKNYDPNFAQNRLKSN